MEEKVSNSAEIFNKSSDLVIILHLQRFRENKIRFTDPGMAAQAD